MTSVPRFSVVIPTRNRPATLAYALDSVLSQSFESFEVIVADNASTPDTAQVVARKLSPRLRYVRVDHPLAMTDNWDQAVAQAAGEFVTVLGDDDALLPGALDVVHRILTASRAKALRWDWVVYCWPDSPPDYANRLALPLSPHVRLVDGRWAISEVLTFRQRYQLLPMLYNSFVDRRLLESIRGSSGRLLASMAPDIYSGFAVAYASGEYASIGMPLGVAGQHGRSNGLSFLGSSSGKTYQEFRALNVASRFAQRHAHAPDLPSIGAAVADSFFWAKERLFASERALLINPRMLVRNIVKELENRPDVADHRTQWNTELLRWARADRHRRMLTWPVVPVSWASSPCPPPGPQPGQVLGAHLHIDARRLGVSDAATCARLCSQLFAVEDPDSVSWSDVTRSPGLPSRASVLKRLAQDLTPPALWLLLSRLKRTLTRT